MEIEIKPHNYEMGGHKMHAECFPFINGEPIYSINNCGNCSMDAEDAEWCDGWVNDKDNAPIGCGSICPKFDLIESKKTMLDELFGEEP